MRQGKRATNVVSIERWAKDVSGQYDACAFSLRLAVPFGQHCGAA